MFTYNDKNYETFEEAMQAVMEAHPELGDDALIEHFDNNVEED